MGHSCNSDQYLSNLLEILVKSGAEWAEFKFAEKKVKKACK